MKPNDKALAQHAVDRFVRRFGNPSYRDLAYYAALPFILTPELLNYLRHAFLRGLNPPLPWVAEADLLLSDLCSQVGHEQFAMKQVIRDYLMTQMRQRLGSKRLEEVARLLCATSTGSSSAGLLLASGSCKPRSSARCSASTTSAWPPSANSR